MKNTCFRFAVVSILLLWSAATAVAQTFAVRGEVYDTESRTALPLFPVQLLAADSSLYAIGATDSLGRFSLAVDSAGAYKLRVTSVGFSRYEKIVSLTAAKPLANVGRVGVKITDINLGEALVTGKATQPDHSEGHLCVQFKGHAAGPRRDAQRHDFANARREHGRGRQPGVAG